MKKQINEASSKEVETGLTKTILNAIRIALDNGVSADRIAAILARAGDVQVVRKLEQRQ